MQHLPGLLIAAAALPASAPAAGPPLTPVPNYTYTQPVAVAKVARIAGRIVLEGDWIPCGAPSPRAAMLFNLPVFDCLGRDNRPFATPTLGTHGAFGPMSCVGPCGTTTDDGTRWSFGTAYNSPITVEDMTDICAPPGAVISEFDVAWLWNPPASSSCIIVVFPYEEVLQRDPAGSCADPSAFTDTGGGGLALNYGSLPPGGDVAYVSFVSDPALEDLGVLLPWTDDNGNSLPDGSYEVIFTHQLDPCDPLPCNTGPVQLLLWGTGDATGEIDRCGHNNASTFTDDSPADGTLTPAECRDLALGRCPDPLGHTIAFCTPACPADLNHDGFVDGIDADTFNNAFESGAASADLNGDGFVDGIDSDLFYNVFEQPCP